MREKKEAGLPASHIKKKDQPLPVSSSINSSDYYITSQINWDVIQDQKFYFPEKFFMSTTLLVRRIFEDKDSPIYREDGYTVRGKRDFSSINFSMKSDPLNLLDKIVFFSVCSLQKAGNKTFTSKQIMRVIGFKESSSKLLNEIEYSLEKLMNAEIKILDYEEQYLAVSDHSIKDYKTIKNESFLPVEKSTLNLNNGRMVSGFKFLSRIPLLQYSEDIKQITCFPSNIIKQVKTISHTKEIICLFYYLMDFFEFNTYKSSKNKKDIEIVISGLVETLLKASNIHFENLSYNSAKVKRKRWFSYIKKLLFDLINYGLCFNGYKLIDFSLKKEEKGSRYVKIEFKFRAIE